MIRISRDIAIDEAGLDFEFIRSSGPGGQNVNKVETAVRLRFEPARSLAAPPDVHERLLALAGRQAVESGVIVIVARRHRTQEANRRDAVERLVALARRASVRPRRRRPTRPTAASRERRLDAKKRRSRLKSGRRAGGADD